MISCSHQEIDSCVIYSEIPIMPEDKEVIRSSKISKEMLVAIVNHNEIYKTLCPKKVKNDHYYQRKSTQKKFRA